MISLVVGDLTEKVLPSEDSTNYLGVSAIPWCFPIECQNSYLAIDEQPRLNFVA